MPACAASAKTTVITAVAGCIVIPLLKAAASPMRHATSVTDRNAGRVARK